MPPAAISAPAPEPDDACVPPVGVAARAASPGSAEASPAARTAAARRLAHSAVSHQTENQGDDVGHGLPHAVPDPGLAPHGQLLLGLFLRGSEGHVDNAHRIAAFGIETDGVFHQLLHLPELRRVQRHGLAALGLIVHQHGNRHRLTEPTGCWVWLTVLSRS
jgi:hypothetical protein